MTAEMQTIYLALGSNEGDRQRFLESAIVLLPPKVRVQKCSPIYETKPWGFKDQADFLNLVLEASTQLSAEDLLTHLKSVEESVGSKASFQNGPREIDIDILYYGDQIITQEKLTIPHPRLAERAFVLVPMMDIAPEFVHPALGKTISELAKFVSQGEVRRVAELERCAEITTRP